MEGDSRNNSDTMAIRLGERRTVHLTRLLIMTLMFYLGYLMIFGDYHFYFTLIITISVLPVLIFVLLRMSGDLKNVPYEKLSLIMKIDMFFGILAFYSGLI